jgi:microcystin-dependent protein
MSQPFIGQVIMFGGSYTPVGWVTCDGRLLSIAEYDVLYSLLGTTYGGDGQTTFGVPDLRSRIPVCMGQGNGLSNYVIGQMAGNESITLQPNQLPTHNHSIATTAKPGTNNIPGVTLILADEGGSGAGTGDGQVTAYGAVSASTISLSGSAIGNSGNSFPHENRQPYQALNFIIAYSGTYPSRS